MGRKLYRLGEPQIKLKVTAREAGGAIPMDIATKRKLISNGKERGYITYLELNDAFPEKDPEETPTPKEILKLIRFGSPQDFDEGIKHLHEPDEKLYQRPIIMKEKKKVKTDA